MDEPYDFTAYVVGIMSASVCTSLSDEDATRRMNLENPTMISSNWVISKDKTFADGHPHPNPCEDYPDTHRHILFEC